MGRKSYKEVISIVCCSDDTFTEFERFVKTWQRGEIPDVFGALGKPQGERDVGEVLRDFSQLSVNRFRPVNGLPDEDLKLVWSQLAEGSVWVLRHAKYQGPEDIVALKEYCKVLKGKDKLGKAIVKYWMTRYQEDFNTWGQLAASYTIPEPWLGEMLKYLPEKPEKPEKEVVTDDVSSSDGDEEDSSKKKKKPKKKSTSVDEITQYQLTLDEKPDCKLVFLDLTHPDLASWEKQEFSCFLGIVKELTSSEGFAIVAVMDFGRPLVNFSAALKEMKDARVLMECGCYEGPRLLRKIQIPSACWQLVYTYVSFDPEDYTPSLNAQTALHPTCNEYETEKGLEDMMPHKGEGAETFNVKNKAPREALLSGRDVIYFANSEKESIFLKEYGKALQRHSDRVRSWYQRYKSLKVPNSSGPQPALASSSQQPGLASTSQQPARAVTDEDEIEDTDVANIIFDDEMKNEARTHLANARRRVLLNPNIV
ncbi:hypothetical protein R1sor_017532 [Riccia sorocarpa]|uniref:Uncharacterized protein n=1 Tax=Riccia sorocarpa TaxID=122646 RepID=A0ABD3I740_9MARC